MSSDDYYLLVSSQQQKQLEEQTKTLSFALCYQQRITNELKQNYLVQLESLKKLRSQFELVDRELAKLDGRHKQVEPSGIEKKTKKRKTETCSVKSLAKLLTEEQKQMLVRALMNS